MRRYQLPLTISRDWYVTKVGGHTSELNVNEIGINGAALEQNTRLKEGDLVRVRPFEDTPHPVFRRNWYRIVSLEEVYADGIGLSTNGEAALPLEDSGIRGDEEIILNSARLVSNH